MILSYEEFIDEVARCVRKEVSVTTDVTICKARKNNGVVKKGICIRNSPEMAAPTIYLEEFYEKYKIREDIDDTVSDIMDIYQTARSRSPQICTKIDNFDSLSGRVVFRLVNWEYNQDLLESVPHMRFLDLAVIFYVLMDANSFSNASMLVTDDHVEMWNTDTETLFELARKNTQELLGFSFVPMEQVLRNHPDSGSWYEEIMYVFSNKERCYGATGMLYFHKLDEIADYMGENFYIMPSSVHELILLRESHAIAEEQMTEMVRQINREEVEKEDILSNAIYYYDADLRKIITIS